MLSFRYSVFRQQITKKGRPCYSTRSMFILLVASDNPTFVAKVAKQEDVLQLILFCNIYVTHTGIFLQDYTFRFTLLSPATKPNNK